MSPTEHFAHLRALFEKELRQLPLGNSSPLKEAVEYILLSKGKRFRPLIVLLVSEALGNYEEAIFSALAVEFFHSASLIADDLPCMDDEKTRRGVPSIHTVFPESIAILASYTLISLGYEYINKNVKALSKKQSDYGAFSTAAFDTVTKAAGIFGATNGQFLDLFPPNQSLETLKTIIYQKTVTLFEISFVCGWIFGGGDLDRLKEVEKLAYHMGMAFQIADDIKDLENDLDLGNTSFAKIVGEKNAYEKCFEELRAFDEKLEELNISTPNLLYLSNMLRDSLKKSPIHQKK